MNLCKLHDHAFDISGLHLYAVCAVTNRCRLYMRSYNVCTDMHILSHPCTHVAPHCKKCLVLPSSAHGKLVLAPYWYNIENHCLSLPCMVKHGKTTIMIFIVVFKLPCMVNLNNGFPCYTSTGQALVYHEHYLVKQGTVCSASECIC